MNLTKVKDNLESRIIKVLGTEHPVSKTISNAAMGCFPARIQKDYAAKGNFNALKFTYYSIGVGLVYTVLQYAIGDSIDQIPVVEHLGKGGKFMGIYGLVNEAVRGSYTWLTKEPIGSLILEIPDRFVHSNFLMSTYLKLTKWFYGI